MSPIFTRCPSSAMATPFRVTLCARMSACSRERLKSVRRLASSRSRRLPASSAPTSTAKRLCASCAFKGSTRLHPPGTNGLACRPRLSYRQGATRPVRLAVRTSASHVENRGSIPLRGAKWPNSSIKSIGGTIPGEKVGYLCSLFAPLKHRHCSTSDLFLFCCARVSFGLFQGEPSEDRHELVSGRAIFGRDRRARFAQAV